MKLSLVAFNQFADIDLFLLWDILNRVRVPEWKVEILADTAQITSATGISISVHGPLENARTSAAVLFVGGPGARAKIGDEKFLASFELDAKTQLVGSLCSGALILAALGLLEGHTATTHPTSKQALEQFLIEVVEEAFVPHGNLATAAGSLAGQHLAHWVMLTLVGEEVAKNVLSSLQPLGEGHPFDGPKAPPPTQRPKLTLLSSP